MALRARSAAERLPYRRAQKQVRIPVMSRTRSSGTSASSMTTSEPPLAWSIGLHRAYSEPGQAFPVLDYDCVDCGVSQQLAQLGPAVVQPAVDFGNHFVKRDAVLSGMGPQPVGLVLQVRFLLSAAHPGVSGDAAGWSPGMGEDVDDVCRSSWVVIRSGGSRRCSGATQSCGAYHAGWPTGTNACNWC